MKYQDWPLMNKEQKNKLVPALRFPEFKNAGEWNYEYGDVLFDSISDKDHNSDLPILAITQEHGAIPREEIDYNVVVTDKSVESYKVVEIGDFIISLRSFQGGIEYSEYKGICSPAYIILRKKTDTVDYFYKHYFKTKRFIADLNKNIEGIRDGKMVSYKQFSDLLLPNPSPTEQQKIADCLSSLDELIDAEKQKLDALKDHKKGLMQQLFPAGGKKVPELRFPGFEGEWEEKALGEIGEFIGGGTPDTSVPEYWGGEIQWFTPSEIKERNLSQSKRTITEKGLKSSSAKLLPKGTLLLSTRATIGDIAIADIECTTNQGFQSLVVYHSEDNIFWYYWITQHKNELLRRSSGSTFLEIGKTEIVKIITYRPKKNEQQKIADCLSAVDELIALQSEKLEILKKHKKGLLQQLFPSLNN